MNAKDQIVAEARRLGFEAVGVARADLPLEADFARYEAFVDTGMHGGMSWLASSREARRRLDSDHILRGAKSVICFAQRYGRSAEEEAADPELARSIARYARGRDYHNGLRKKLRKIARLVRTLGSGDAPIEARPMCDDVPVLERAWAARSGLGFVGKNGLIIVPGVGSLVLLGEVVTTLELEPDPPIPERCGACTRCLDVCPTNAFPLPFVLDPRRCVAYLTIENRDEIPAELREGVGDRLFGCDDCQTVCPFNARSRNVPGAAIDPRFDVDPRWAVTSLRDLVALDDASYAAFREGTPVARATRIGLARNAAVVLGNRGDDGDLEVLESARVRHDAAIVREAAAWAIGRIEARRGGGGR
ncbi:MAG: Epoxyqueuosine (oQ) reductase QueG [Labilithrix sp.]|nr:Epoxyqueuosine (oQ) reductase QueG [Labilithrix sp.]